MSHVASDTVLGRVYKLASLGSQLQLLDEEVINHHLWLWGAFPPPHVIQDMKGSM
jgi:hypothetical protein